MSTDAPALFRPFWRSRRAAAIAGILFGVLLLTAMVMTRIALAEGSLVVLQSDPQRRTLIRFSLGLVPFAGIAFLWFIGVIREQLGAVEDRLFSTVFFGSGLLFLAMLFVGAIMSTSLLDMLDRPSVDRGPLGLRPRQRAGALRHLRHADGRGLHALGQHGRYAGRRHAPVDLLPRVRRRPGAPGRVQRAALAPAGLPHLGPAGQHRDPRPVLAVADHLVLMTTVTAARTPLTGDPERRCPVAASNDGQGGGPTMRRSVRRPR